ncbi:MAG TPA: preprotein translocase subunit YajC [Gemmatimonadaceae bacterium]|nr:preprotein translocase subunit YajC [Gemmatimonadaceae bacterium]
MISLPIVPALLLLQTAPSGGGGALTGLFIQMGLIFAIFYFLMIRPRRKQQQQHEERLRNLRKGDQIVTAGGLVGEVVHMKEAATQEGGTRKSMEDHITIKSGDARLIVERGRIARVAGEAGTTSPHP